MVQRDLVHKVFGPIRIYLKLHQGNWQLAPLPPPRFPPPPSVPGKRSRPFTAFPQPVSRASLDAPMDDHVYSLYDKLYRQQNRDFPTSEAFLKHVAFLLAKADIMVTDWNELRTVSHDPNWYRSSTEPQEAIQQFLCFAPSSAQNQSRCFFGYATSASKGST